MAALGRAGKSLEVLEVLFDHGAKLNIPSVPFGEAPIHIAATTGNTPAIEWLIGKGTSVDLPTADLGNTPQLLRDLFDTRPFEPFFGSTDVTPTMIAAGEGHVAAVETLIKHNARLDVVDSQGYTALHYAAGAYWGDNVEIVEHLYSKGANKLLRAQSGELPVDLAIQRGYASTASYLST